MDKPITVLFDAGPMVNGQKSGVGYYTYRLIDALARNFPDDIKLVGHYFNFLGRKHPQLPTHPNIRYKSSRLLPGKVLSILRRVGLQLPFDLLVKSKGDIVLFPNYVCLPVLQPAKKVIAIHDLCFEDFPEYLQKPNRNFLKRFVPPSVKKADLVITISESTKKSIQKHYATDSKKFLITPIPPEATAKEKTPPPKNLVLPKKYLLFISTLEPRKNYLGLARAYALLPGSLKKDYGLVLAGGMGWETEEPMAEIKQLQESGENIVVTGYVDESTRLFLYQNASLLVVPSHYEGFGMPILEAMSYAVPVAVSDIPVFHEVAGGAALYFNKDDPASIASAIKDVITNESLQAQLIEKSVAQLKNFSWDDVADEVMRSFRGILDSKK